MEAFYGERTRHSRGGVGSQGTVGAGERPRPDPGKRSQESEGRLPCQTPPRSAGPWRWPAMDRGRRLDWMARVDWLPSPPALPCPVLPPSGPLVWAPGIGTTVPITGTSICLPVRSRSAKPVWSLLLVYEQRRVLTTSRPTTHPLFRPPARR